MNAARLAVSSVCLGALCAALGGCKSNAGPTAEPDPRPPASAAPPVASAAAVPRRIPTMDLAKLGEPAALTGVYPVEGAVLVSERHRVGRVVGDTVEWIGKLLLTDSAVGPTDIRAVYGHYPDSIDLLYVSMNGRAGASFYAPLTGKGLAQTFGAGGEPAYVVGLADVGDSTVLAGWTMGEGSKLLTVRGPALQRASQSPTQAGCKPGEVNEEHPGTPAISPSVIGASRGGVMMILGDLCDKRGLAAEIWEATGPSRIVDLGALAPGKRDSNLSAILRGKGDELFVVANGTAPILRYAGGTFEPLPRLEKPMKNAVTSQSGELYASDGETLQRIENGAWAPVARLAWPTTFRGMAIDGDAIYGSVGGAVWKYREGRGVALEDGCATPFVYLYEVSPKSEAMYAFPTTAKALSTFPDAGSLALVDFKESGVRRLGVPVTSKEQGEALLAHVHATMKDEAPKLLCYAPTGARKIPLRAAGK